MDYVQIYFVLLAVIVFISHIFRKSVIPISLLLVISGMVLSFFPYFPPIRLNPALVLNIFLPLLIYQISYSFSWKNFKTNLRPIALLSIGHVFFITFIVAYLIHLLIPQLGWPLAFILGAVVSPPDSVAIVSIAEKIHMPERIITILEGEGMLNDVTALILFRLAVVAVVTHEFSVIHAVSSFFVIVIGETLYGFGLGHLIGKIRLKLQDSKLHILVSVLTPFLAYLPVEKLGGSGILATVVTGFVIGQVYSVRFSPDFRLVSRAAWPALAYAVQSILFLLIGLNMRSILQNISAVPTELLIILSVVVIAAVILGRFIWVYVGAVIPRLLFPSILKADPYPPWQYLFVISWAGIRGSISLAAALAVPTLPSMIAGTNPRDLVIFLVFCVIAATLLLQGITLPLILKVIGIPKFQQKEKFNEYQAELTARLKMTKAVLHWLNEFKVQVTDNKQMLEQVKLLIREYRLLKTQLREKITDHRENSKDNEIEENTTKESCLLLQIIDIERTELLGLWRKDKVNLTVKDRLLERLDHRSRHLPK